MFCQALIAKVIVSALSRAQQENLPFRHVKNVAKKAKSFWTGCEPVCYGACAALLLPSQGLGSPALSLQRSTIRINRALEQSCFPSSELFTLGFRSTFSVSDAQVSLGLAELGTARPFPLLWRSFPSWRSRVPWVKRDYSKARLCHSTREEQELFLGCRFSVAAVC